MQCGRKIFFWCNCCRCEQSVRMNFSYLFYDSRVNPFILRVHHLGMWEPTRTDPWWRPQSFMTDFLSSTLKQGASHDIRQFSLASRLDSIARLTILSLSLNGICHFQARDLYVQCKRKMIKSNRLPTFKLKIDIDRF